MADGLVISNESGGIVFANPSFLRLIRQETKEITGKHIASLIECGCFQADDTTGGAEINCQTLITAKEKDTAVHNSSIVCSDGVDVTMPVSHIAIINRKGEITGYVTIVYIVHSGSVQQAQTEFVSTVSHELRTPLTSIKGFADTILRAGERLDTNQQRRYVGIIKDQADRLTRLVEDLLAVSRLESRKLQFTIRAVDFNDAVQRVLRNLHDKASQHQLVVRIPPALVPVWADADRLEQILTNLIENAIKYSQAGTTVSITARETDIEPCMVEFSVSDQGVGIPQENISEIFSKFARLDNPLIRQTEGTGLGLYITRSLVLALGGQINVESGSSGTIFTVQLPAASLEEQAARGRGIQL